MTRRLASLALAVIVPAWLLTPPASAQERRGAADAPHGGGASASGGGSHAVNGGGSTAHQGASTAREGGSTANRGTATAIARGDGTADRNPRTQDGASTSGTPPYSRPRNGRDPVGTAVPRGTVPATGAVGVFVPAGYYGGLIPFGYYGDPYGYYGGYYDPWYGGYPSYGPPPTGADEEGSLRLKVKPKEAEVYVDGYYAGIVDEFDGVFQKLPLEKGGHHIEIRAPGYEPLAFDIRITAGHKTTYEGELQKIP